MLGKANLSDGCAMRGWGGAPTREGDRVRFRSADIFLPSAEEVLALSSTSELEGVVINFSDSGTEPRAFAVVDVIRRQNVVVPVEKLRVVNATKGT